MSQKRMPEQMIYDRFMRLTPEQRRTTLFAMLQVVGAPEEPIAPKGLASPKKRKQRRPKPAPEQPDAQG